MTREEKTYLDSCKEMIEMDRDIKVAERRKRKIQDDLDEVNGQLHSMQRHFKDLEKKNIRLKAAYVRKLNVSPQKVANTSVGQNQQLPITIQTNVQSPQKVPNTSIGQNQQLPALSQTNVQQSQNCSDQKENGTKSGLEFEQMDSDDDCLRLVTACEQAENLANSHVADDEQVNFDEALKLVDTDEPAKKDDKE